MRAVSRCSVADLKGWSLPPGLRARLFDVIHDLTVLSEREFDRLQINWKHFPITVHQQLLHSRYIELFSRASSGTFGTIYLHWFRLSSPRLIKGRRLRRPM